MPNKTAEWTVEIDGEYVYLTHIKHQYVVQVKADVEGIAVDMFNIEEEPVASCYAFYEDEADPSETHCDTCGYIHEVCDCKTEQ